LKGEDEPVTQVAAAEERREARSQVQLLLQKIGDTSLLQQQLLRCPAWDGVLCGVNLP